METGIQVSSLKPLLTTPEEVRTACEKMAALGSGPVQLQWIDPAVSIEAIAGALEENHLQSVSVQDFYDTVAGNFEYYVNLNAATGGTWLCVSRIPEARKSVDGLDEYVRQLRAMQDKLTPLGQKLCFHPVTGDYRAIPGMDAVALKELQHFGNGLPDTQEILLVRLQWQDLLHAPEQLIIQRYDQCWLRHRILLLWVFIK